MASKGKGSSTKKAPSKKKIELKKESILNITEPAIKEVKEEPQKDKAKLEVLCIREYLMGISCIRYIDMVEGSKEFTIENIGVGDLYCSEGKVKFSKEELVLTGETESFNKGVYVISTCRPTIRVTYYG